MRPAGHQVSQYVEVMGGTGPHQAGNQKDKWQTVLPRIRDTQVLVCCELTVMYGITIAKLEDTIRDMKYPPLIGEPTKEDIIGTLEAALNFILSEDVDPDEFAETKERVEDLEFGVTEAISELDDLIDDIIIKEDQTHGEDRLCEIADKARHIKYNLQVL